MAAAFSSASFSLVAVSFRGCLTPILEINSLNFLRSSATSIVRALVPMIFAPAMLRRLANLMPKKLIPQDFKTLNTRLTSSFLLKLSLTILFSSAMSA